MWRNALSSFLFLLLVFVALHTAVAQNVNASVTGTVTDPSGAVVPGASVIARNIDTGITFPGKTNQSGVYTIASLPIGNYTVTISASGYKKASVKSFALIGGQDARFDVALSLGNVSEVVNVDTMPPILDTQDSTLSTTFEAKIIDRLPLVADNVMTLGMLTPGVVQANPAGFDNISNPTSYSNPSFNVNGNREQSNNFTLDGMDINDAIDNEMAYSPSRNSLAEYQMVTGNNTAEWGNANGGQVVMITKSGTNVFHGEAFLQDQTTVFNANAWSNKHGVTITPRTGQDRAYFGATIGGPIKHDKLFFFIDYRGVRQHVGTTPKSFQPDPNFGNDQTHDMTGQAYLKGTGTAYSPAVSRAVQIVNPAAQFVLSHPELYAVCNQYAAGVKAGTPGVGCVTDNGSTTSGNNFVGYQLQKVSVNQGDVKIDWKASNKDLLSIRYTQVSNVNSTPIVAMPVDSTYTGDYPYNGFVVNWTHTFGGNLLNDARVGFSRSRYTNYPIDPTGLIGKNGVADYGIPNYHQVFDGEPTISLGGTKLINMTSFGISTGGRATDGLVNAFNYGDKLEWSHGKHFFKIGGQAIRYQENRYYAGNYGPDGQWNFTGSTSNTALSTGDAWGDFLADEATKYYVGSSHGRWGQRQWRDALYFQDDYKILPNLTLNLGIRWEWDQPMYEVHNHMVNINPYTGGISYAGLNGANRSLINAYWLGFMPRFGFAFAPASLQNRFVIRGGYGITNFMEGLGANQRMTQNPPFIFNSSATAAGSAPLRMTDGYPAQSVTPTTIAGNMIGWDPRVKPAFVQQFDLLLAYQFTHSLGLQVGYVGQDGNHLFDLLGLNQAPCSIYPLVAGGTFCNSPLATVLPNLAAHNVQYTESEGVMNYNSLQATLQQHTSRDLMFLANYTYSKSMSDSPGYYGSSGVSGSAGAYPQDSTNLAGDYGPSFFDTTHNISFAIVYSLPFGRGQMIGKHWNRLVDGVLGGWKASISGSYHTGFPQTIFSTPYYSVNGVSSGVVRANMYRPLKIVNRSHDHWLGTDPSAKPATNTTYTSVPFLANTVMGYGAGSTKVYSKNDNGTSAFGEELTTGFGNSKVGSVRMPGYHNVDASVSKDFSLSRGMVLNFRANAFNVLNGVSWGSFYAVVSNSDFGEGTSTTSTVERHLQLGLNLKF
ncbi:MAG: carboxypeptidase-like regulatory domain-containing protein [Acidobacteriaceae bacterium]|nr:carboxypeptidase-like regulatory domain-containing protein [Acidobacteriaceae bacterium]